MRQHITRDLGLKKGLSGNSTIYLYTHIAKLLALQQVSKRAPL
ncbi:Uncharacterized protein YP598_3429 [Yersinia pseudotuberculosis]|uniref:Uncharacterized protein n=1 Tax=Yersinia pseudotuberculosis serotype O:1b (strain IP 31758) TaxID=349747 RepID=A0A0U1QV69_YERP3|nr:hypothetical protein YpsIP31758_3347 [Yersinia pseudotuberculosis IP 31758]UFA63043.1 Uncharacterized protein YP598_3429 [Yersinia pseudotuberculosis]